MIVGRQIQRAESDKGIDVYRREHPGLRGCDSQPEMHAGSGGCLDQRVRHDCQHRRLIARDADVRKGVNIRINDLPLERERVLAATGGIVACGRVKKGGLVPPLLIVLAVGSV